MSKSAKDKKIGAATTDKELKASTQRGYEIRDVKISVVLMFLIPVATVSALSFVVVYGLIALWDKRPEPTSVQPSPVAEARPLPELYVLQPNPPLDFQAFQAEEKAEVSAYRWIDKEAGLAKIPVNEALDWVADHGIPEWPLPPELQQPALDAVDETVAGGNVPALTEDETTAPDESAAPGSANAVTAVE
ncbi:MAG: hypothetical protein KJ052_11375 [Candidatus Hydrogenedentes bacterium]|nr:hypothetical protein [Candidatus Hydrogenedentota bacterium]